MLVKGFGPAAVLVVLLVAPPASAGGASGSYTAVDALDDVPELDFTVPAGSTVSVSATDAFFTTVPLRVCWSGLDAVERCNAGCGPFVFSASGRVRVHLDTPVSGDLSACLASQGVITATW